MNGARLSIDEINDAIAEAGAAAGCRVLDMRNVVANRPVIEAGLKILDAGGDFADGVIAFDGQWLGAETFLSFDKRAVKLLDQQGASATPLS